MSRDSDSALQILWPSLFVIFVNACGNVGLGFLPSLIVERGYSTSEGTLILGCVKAALLIGLFSGGWLAFRLGARQVILSSLLLSAVGLWLMPEAKSAFLLLCFGMLAQFGGAMIPSNSRVLLMSAVPQKLEQEAMAWGRAISNAGEVFAFLGAVWIGKWGIGVLMKLDSATSFVAAGIGLWALSKKQFSKEKKEEIKTHKIQKTHTRFFWIVGTLFVYATLFEAFLVSASGRLRVLFSDQGVQFFSYCLITNTVLCALFGVWFAKKIRSTLWALPVGTAIVGVGLSAFTWSCTVRSLPLILLSVILITGGELLTQAVQHIELVRAIPSGKNAGTSYGMGMLAQGLGKLTGATLAFSLIVRAQNPSSLVLLILSGAFSVFLFLGLKQTE